MMTSHRGSHLGLSEVWKHLHEKPDMTNLTHEILGQYALSTHQKPTATIQDLTAHLFVHLRIIFDFQRAYLQARFPCSVSQSYLIPAPELLSSIRYLDQIRSEVYGKVSHSDSDLLEKRFFGARTILSGLRALVLLQCSFPTNVVHELHDSVRIWCWKSKDNVLEAFILEKCVELILQITQTSGPNGQVDLRKLSTGSQIGDIRKKASESFLRELKRLREGEGESFWALFDLLWAAEVDFVQASVDLVSHVDAEVSHQQVNDFCELLDDSSEPELCLKKVALEWCDIGPGSSPIRLPPSKSFETLHPSSRRDSITCFVLFLEHRQSRILNTPSEITSLDFQLEDSLKSWYGQASNINDLDLSYNEALRVGPLDDFRTEISCTYILNCPQLHVLPWFCLKSLISGEETKGIGEEPAFIEFQTAVRCPQCKVARYIRSARKIEPIHHISNKLKKQLRKIHIDTEELQPLTEEPYAPSSPSTFVSRPSSPPTFESKRPSLASAPERKGSSSSGGSQPMVSSTKSWTRRFSSGMNLNKRKSLADISPVTKPMTKTLHNDQVGIWSHGFSTDNTDIVLWDKESGYVFASTVRPGSERADATETWQWRKYLIPDIRFATGARGKVAGISETSRLSVFAEPGSPPILDIQLAESSAVRSIAISNQGELVAVGFDNCFLIYSIKAGSDASPTTRQSLDTNPKSRFNSQRLNFSRDGTKLIVATRKTQNLQGRIELNFHDEVDYTKSWRRLLDPSSLPNNDLGLSAVFFDNYLKRAVLAGFISKPYNIVHSMLSGEVWSSSRGPNSDRKFQAAAQSPTGSKFTFINSSGHLFQLDLRQRQSALQDLGTRLDLKDPPRSPDDFISAAMPDDKTINVFWIDHGMGILSTVQEGGKPIKRKIRLPETHVDQLPEE